MDKEKQCHYCLLEYEEDESTHNSTPRHIFNHMLFQWFNKRSRLVKDRHGCEIYVAPVRENGRLVNYTEDRKKGKHSVRISPSDLSLFNNKINFSCKIINIQREKSILLTKAHLLHPYDFYTIEDPKGLLDSGKVLELEPGSEYEMIVKFSSDQNNLIGSYSIPVCFSFQTVGDKPFTFIIARFLNIVVAESLENTEPVAEGKSPFTSNDWPNNIKLIYPNASVNFDDQYSIPPKYEKLLKYGLEECQWMSREEYEMLLHLKKTVMLSDRISPKKYNEFWHLVLWMEEIGQALGLQRYNMEKVFLKLKRGILELEVPGLAEKRPSVIAGDLIDIKIPNTECAFRGVIRYIHDKSVEIHNIDKQLMEFLIKNPDVIKEMDIRFVLGRLHFERMHQAVEQIEKNGMVPDLFPEMTLAARTLPKYSINLKESEYFNKMIYTNPEQKTAVLNILNGTAGTAPFIVFGPPGTGKTVTIVEAILQIKKKTKKRILVCAPANAACDLLTEKLAGHCKEDELLRVMSSTVDASIVHKTVLKYSNFIKDKDFRKVQEKELLDYRIIISTLIHVGKYMRKYHPDVVFIDEAAQACEPEVSCAIAMLAKNNASRQIILAGDPHQLGPSLSSKVSEKFGLGISFLERLMTFDLYKSRNTNFIAKLLQNFRSNSMILKLPNELFYDGDLKPMSASSEMDPLANMFVFNKIKGASNLKIKKGSIGKAIEFCSVLSKERREGRSPSYYNEKEMLMVLKYVQALTTLTFNRDEYQVKQEQIGVVTPYIRQVYKVKDVLKRNGFDQVEVGTTETFQGREKRVIIVTTVRAQKDLLLFDKRYKLGFVKNEKRFNVALTRAMSKLIIIGCAQVLGTDKKWLKFINLCKQHKAFYGAPYEKRDKRVMTEITNRLANIEFEDHWSK